MSYGEAIRLARVLASDPSSEIAAALSGWSHSLSRTDVTLRDLYDLQHASKSQRKPQPYPRPWDERPLGQGTSLTIAEYRELRDSIENKEVNPRG